MKLINAPKTTPPIVTKIINQTTTCVILVKVLLGFLSSNNSTTKLIYSEILLHKLILCNVCNRQHYNLKNYPTARTIQIVMAFTFLVKFLNIVWLKVGNCGKLGSVKELR